jgi:hypothetical protein
VEGEKMILGLGRSKGGGRWKEEEHARILSADDEGHTNHTNQCLTIEITP